MKKIFSLTLLFLAVSFCLRAQQNVLLIIADDLGTDYLSFYEDAKDTANTPNIKALLANGVRFKNAWSNPICSPARAGMLTGRYAFRTGVGTVITGTANGQLDTAEISIAKLLKRATPIPYATANIGKWHLHTATPANRNNPAALGYDHYAGNFIGQVADYYNWTKIVDGAAAVTVTNYATTEQVDDAIDWLDGLAPNKPFFLWQAFNAPHTPFHLPPANLHTVPGLTGTQQHITQNRSEYYKAMLEALDTEIGRLFNWLEMNGVLDNTNIIFIGDNGNDGQISQIADPDHHKGTIYEYGVHVPLIIAGPAVVAPNRASDALVNAQDLFATVVEMAGLSNWKDFIPGDKPVDAVSLLPILKNESSAVREWIFSEIFDPVSQPEDGKAIRDMAFKLLQFDDGHQEFYNVVNDPTEQTDLLLQPVLDTDAHTHYSFLCHALANLLNTSACNPLVEAQELDEPAFSTNVYPNPARDYIFVQRPDQEAFISAVLTDQLGRVSAPLQLGSDGNLDVSRLAGGVYFLTLIDSQGKMAFRKFQKIDPR